MAARLGNLGRRAPLSTRSGQGAFPASTAAVHYCKCLQLGSIRGSKGLGLRCYKNIAKLLHFDEGSFPGMEPGSLALLTVLERTT
jgi:hypothetical protein